ncbi:menaquinone-dependent protoporphyrinogen IX dehydrogenase [Lutibacter sp.]|uniref:menaquinone-dependent protoporphyrinogen IX dehydrogenase n=1 Tax=Lutibacter sp. TaxID=1925666 RepID=UPI0025C1FBBC|nr:menaquinone-dependent protoporphyrinogen IX dehydrogenase [Lutibacter sp.]MCF6182273.1 menaquinone-dependent protoporphyrinogen IX dehydrogenase [Lutibacter sp.]
MSNKIGIVYSSIDGQTHKICNFIKDELQKSNQTVDLFSIDNFTSNITNYNTFVIASSIRYGVHNKRIIDFINTNKKELDATKTVFISVNLVARKSEKNTPKTNPYVIKFFKTIDWKPTVIEVFAGKLDYKKYPFWDRIMIQFIMWMTKGPTDKNTKIEYTNWGKVTQFTNNLSSM